MASSRPSTSRSPSLGGKRRKYFYIHELPYCDIYELARHLNADKKWPILAGYMGFKMTDIGIFGNATSPAEEVLKSYGQRAGKTDDVFAFLYRMEYYVGMLFIEKYVDPEILAWLRTKNDSAMSSNLLERCRPTAPPYASGASKLEPDSKNVNCRRSESALKGHHKDNKLPSPAGKKPPLVVHLPDSVRIVSLKNFLPESAKLHNDKTKVVDFEDINLGPIKKIPHSELAVATQGFDDSKILGRGGFGTVYRGFWKNITVAIKKLKVQGNHEHIRQVLTELRVLEQCRFENIIALYGVSVDNRNAPCLVYEFMPGGSLDDWLRKKVTSQQRLTWSQRAVIARGTACGLNYLHTIHDTPLVHGDVKPANILLDVNLEPKLGDFGLTREGPVEAQTHRDVTHINGTRCYLPEEYLRWRKLSPKVDVYSFGFVLLELATSLKPVDEQRSHDRLNLFVESLKNEGSHWKVKDPCGGEGGSTTFEVFVELGLKCSARFKNDRPDMEKVLEILKSGRLAQTSPRMMPVGYSRDPTATVNQNLRPMNLPVAASLSPRLSPTDNLQVPSPVPQTATTDLNQVADTQQPVAQEPTTSPTVAAACELPALSLLNIAGNSAESESLSDTSPN